MTHIAIVDYDVGNLLSVQRALFAVQADCVITSDPEVIDSAYAIVLPGVGAFGTGTQNLKRRGLVAPLQHAAEQGKPILGICLGMQLLMDDSEEFGHWPGLGLLPGHVVRLDGGAETCRVKIPQIGWNQIAPKRDWTGTLLDGVDEGSFMYFVHSFCVDPANDADCLATCDYGQNRFCAVVSRQNVMGCQFHPEKSGEAGLQVLKNFVEKA